MNQKKASKSGAKERCPRCKSTNFATSADGNIRYCTLPNPDNEEAYTETAVDEEGNPVQRVAPKAERYNGVAAKGCGAMWPKADAQTIRADYQKEKLHEVAGLAREAKNRIKGFETATNGADVKETIELMGKMHENLKGYLTIIENIV